MTLADERALGGGTASRSWDTTERALYAQSGAERVFGVLNVPTGGAPAPIGVLFVDSALMDLGNNRVWVRAARQLAQSGVPSLRLDLHGRGVSTGEYADRGVGGQTEQDLLTGARLLSESCAEIVVVASCWYGIPAIAAAPRLPELVAVVAATPPLNTLVDAPSPTAAGLPGSSEPMTVLRTLLTADARKLLRSDRDYARWVLRRAVRRLSRAVRPARETQPVEGEWERLHASIRARGVKVRAVYGHLDPQVLRFDEPAYEAARVGLGDALEVRMVEGRMHTLRDTRAQEIFLRLVDDTVRDLGGLR
jgi:alpha/beta superfamily hydrolase